MLLLYYYYHIMQDQYEFIHQGLVTMLKQFSLYSNFNDGTAVKLGVYLLILNIKYQ